jgi:hypothetical protein
MFQKKWSSASSAESLQERAARCMSGSASTNEQRRHDFPN